MQKRSITHIFVVNPPDLGRKRREMFDAQFNNWQRPVPARTYLGVNKNWLDIRGWRYERVIKDDRRLWNTLGLRWGLQPRAEKFIENYGCSPFEGLSADPERGDKYGREDGSVLEVGRLAEWLSHIKIWQRISRFPEDELCMVVEDKVLINPAIEFEGIEWPEESDFLHLWPGGIMQYEGYSDSYVKILRKWSPEKHNWTSLGYILPPAGARRFLSGLKPITGRKTVDLYLLYRCTPHLFATREPWVRPMYVTSLCRTRPLLWLLIRALAFNLRFLLPLSWRERYPYLLNSPHSQFDLSRSDPPEKAE